MKKQNFGRVLSQNQQLCKQHGQKHFMSKLHETDFRRHWDGTARAQGHSGKLTKV